MCTRDDISEKVNWFLSDAEPTQRYASFDYCFNYFQTTKDLTTDMEKSCLALGFYLASWGMMRGSSFMLQKSAKHLQPTVEYFASIPQGYWQIDVDTYTEENIERILEIYHQLKGKLIPADQRHVVLVTKVMLGVMGNIPAFDSYFSKAFRLIFGKNGGRFNRVNQKSLQMLSQFYQSNQAEIDRLSESLYTTSFHSGEATKVNYPKAKIVDMYGFSKGING